MIKPNLFIVGLPRCGTTSLHFYLNQHPDVDMSDEKEPHYFNFDSNHRFYTDLEQYLKLFESHNSKYSGEASVWYLKSNVAISNIMDYNPDSKFIVCIRNPIDQFLSLHKKLVYTGDENITDPQKAWNSQWDRIGGHLNYPSSCIEKSNLHYAENCSAGKLLFAHKKHFSSENFKVILFDDLKSNTRKVVNEVFDFLGIEPKELSSYQIKNASGIVRKSEKINRLSRAIYKWKKKVGLSFSFGILNFIRRKNRKEQKKRNIISEAFRSELRAYFSDDIKQLSEFLNQDLSHWK